MRFFFARVIPRMSYIAAWGLHRFPSFRELTNCTWKNKVAYHSNDQVINLIKGMKSQNRKYWQWTGVQLKVIPRNLGYKSKLNSIFFLWGRGGLHSEELITRLLIIGRSFLSEQYYCSDLTFYFSVTKCNMGQPSVVFPFKLTFGQS